MSMESLIGFTRGLAFVLAAGVWLTPQIEAQQPTPEAQGAETLEHVLEAIESLPAANREEMMDAYDHMSRTPAYFHFQNTACLTLRYVDWRQDEPEDVGRVGLHRVGEETWREWLMACALDRDEIAATHTQIARRMLTTAASRFTEDQLERIATCTGETVADRYLEHPVNHVRLQSNMRLEAMTECRRRHGR